MKTGKKLLTIGVFLVFLSTMALANGLNLNSIGSRAMAMGGAFVGLADDFSTAYWNPAGMAQFTKKTFGFYGSDVIPSQSYKFDMLGMTLVDAQTPTKHYFSGMGAYYHPINEKLVVGVSVYVPSGLGAAWDGADFSLISSGQTYKWESQVGM
ncbi:MAG: outer membrane protein transport protein, partial [Candidatus Aminicenantes bacterium]|nr:outer membrane protein transport protein [Candidatus Aminicenantes bacterium]